MNVKFDWRFDDEVGATKVPVGLTHSQRRLISALARVKSWLRSVGQPEQIARSSGSSGLWRFRHWRKAK